jgi:hypothetical protein
MKAEKAIMTYTTLTTELAAAVQKALKAGLDKHEIMDALNAFVSLLENADEED